MATEGEKEEIIKDSLSVMSERIPTIIEEVEELQFNEIIKNAKNLEKYIGKISEKYSKAENYLDDMNEACNNMFIFMKNNKIEKKLRRTVIEIILATYKLNEVYNISPIYIQYYEIGRYEGEMNDGKREGHGKFYFKSGDFYEGEFKNNHKHGKGKYIYI